MSTLGINGRKWVQGHARACGLLGDLFMENCPACSFFADEPSKAKGMFTQWLYRSLGLAAHLGWARLLVHRFRDLVEVHAPTREDPGSGRRHFASDDEDAFEYENYHNPDHTY